MATSEDMSNNRHNKTFLNSKDKNKADSKTNVYPSEKLFLGSRKVASFRCNEELWLSFKQQMKADGSSICHMLEAMINAVLGAYPELVNNRNTITIEKLDVRRIVQRHRRVSHEYEAETNKYMRNPGFWVYDSDSTLNVNRHAAGCECDVCRGVLS